MRDSLVQAGVELLDEPGREAHSIGLREVARKAGVSHGAPRRWFPTHTSLLAAIAAAGLRDLSTAVAYAAGEPADLPAAARAYVDFAVDRPMMFALIFRHDLLEASGEQLRTVSIPMYEWFATALPHADSDTVPADSTRALGLWTGVHGVAALAATGPLALIASDTSPHALCDAVVAQWIGVA